MSTGLMHDSTANLTFEWLGNADEAHQLWFEVFAMRVYARFGVLQRALTAHRAVLLLDVGANIGLFSLFACLLARQIAASCAVRLVAVEPIDAICAVLQRNLTMCDAVPPHHRVVCAAAVDRATLLTAPDGLTEIAYFPQMPGESTRHRAEVERMQQRARARVECAVVKQCRVTTLSQLIVAESDAVPVILKIDVEGDELLALDGIDECCWSRIAVVLIEVHDVDDRLARVVERLRRAEFGAICVEPQESVETDDYVLTIDPKLRLFMSLRSADRLRQSSPSSSTAKLSAIVLRLPG